MCTVCGCEPTVHGEHSHHDHPHPHHHDDRHHSSPLLHPEGVGQTQVLKVELDILAHNNDQAARNRAWMAERGVLALNLVSSPGSGKTTLLCRTVAAMMGEIPCAVIEGDQQTSNDADRIRATGVPALQINTGKGCHLDAAMIEVAVGRLPPKDDSVLFIENVGNLVCPSAFDLGEAYKVAILSVTEGEDKPLKYPDIFHAAEVMILNKTDLLPHLDFDVDACITYARRINPSIRIISLSAQTGEGMDVWLDWIRQERDRLMHRRIAMLEARLNAAKAALASGR